eukprot:3479380-Rhodomonas_salina.5
MLPGPNSGGTNWNLRQRRRCSQPSGTARHARWKTTRTGPTAARATLRNQRPPPSKSTSGMARRFRSRAPWRTRAPGPCPLTRNSRTSRRPRPPATSSSTSPRTTGPMPLLPMPASDSATLLRPRPTPTPLVHAPLQSAARLVHALRYLLRASCTNSAICYAPSAQTPLSATRAPRDAWY